MTFVDVSSNNGAIDVASYARGRVGSALGRRPRWFCRKVTEGTGYHWPEGDGYADQAHAHGLHVVHYGWLRPDATGRAQADYFVEQVRAHVRAGDVLMCDFEATAGAPDGPPKVRAEQLVDWMQRVNERLQAVPTIVYTGNWYLTAVTAAAVKRYPVLLADYAHRRPLNPHGFHVVGHQFTDKHKFAGITRPDNDANRWLVDPIELFHFQRGHR